MIVGYGSFLRITVDARWRPRIWSEFLSAIFDCLYLGRIPERDAGRSIGYDQSASRVMSATVGVPHISMASESSSRSWAR